MVTTAVELAGIERAELKLSWMYVVPLITWDAAVAGVAWAGP